MTTPTGTTTYTYDTLNRLTDITNSTGEITTFTYDALSRRTSITYANGVTTTYSYDSASRLTELLTLNSQPSILNSYVYTYNKTGNRISMTDRDGPHSYSYDDQYRLTDASHPQAFNPTESFAYDPVGNRMSSHLSTGYSYDNQNRLLAGDQYTYSYNDNGNMTGKTDKTSGATVTYQYDSENMLTGVTTPTDTISYKYDGLGRRIEKTVNGTVTRFVYDQEDILFELDGNNNIKAVYTHGPGIDEPISVDRDTNSDGTMDTTYFYHVDGLGSITAMTDSNGNVVQTYVYDTFGNIVDKAGDIENSYTYTGREWDEEAGLYYYRARYYDARIGRFITEDPIGFGGGDVNLYGYVRNSPVHWIDPMGNQPCSTDEITEDSLKEEIPVEITEDSLKMDPNFCYDKTWFATNSTRKKFPNATKKGDKIVVWREIYPSQLKNKAYGREYVFVNGKSTDIGTANRFSPAKARLPWGGCRFGPVIAKLHYDYH